MDDVHEIPYAKRAFIVYRKLAFLALKQREIEWTRPFLYRCLKEYKDELRTLLEEKLLNYYQNTRKLKEIDARRICNNLFKDGYFLEEMMSYVQTGILNPTINWAEQYWMPISEVDNIFLDMPKELYKSKLKKYFNEFGEIEGRPEDIIHNYYICNILFDINIEDVFNRVYILHAYNIIIKKIDRDDIYFTDSIPYPTFLLKNISSSKIILKENDRGSQVKSKTLNLSLDLNENTNGLPAVISDFLFEFYRFHVDLKDNILKEKSVQLGNAEEIIKLIWFCESLIGNQTGLKRIDELVTLFMMLIYFDFVVGLIKNEYALRLGNIKDILIEEHKKNTTKYPSKRVDISIYGFDNNYDNIDFSARILFKNLQEELRLLCEKSKMDEYILKLADIINKNPSLRCRVNEGEYMEFKLVDNNNLIDIEVKNKEALKVRMKRSVRKHAQWMSEIVKI